MLASVASGRPPREPHAGFCRRARSAPVVVDETYAHHCLKNVGSSRSRETKNRLPRNCMYLHVYSRQENRWSAEKPIFDGSIASVADRAKNRSTRFCSQRLMAAEMADLTRKCGSMDVCYSV